MPRRSLATHVLTALVAVFLAATATAQSFAPVAQVNDDVVTAWELQQRQRMLAVLNAPPEAQANALESLINERIQLQAADMMDVTVSDEAIQAGIEEFATRGGLSAEQFLQLITNEGVDPATVRDFIRAGVAWRNAARARFEGEIDISEADVAREQEEVAPEEGPRVLLSEIILPAGNEIERLEAQELAEEITRIRSVAAFSEAARAHSTAPSAEEGGRVDWIPLADLQGPVANAIQGMSPGQVTNPIPIPEALALFQLRGTADGPVGSGDVVLDYAMYLIPGGRTESALQQAARVDARVDTCDDLYGVAEGQPPGRLVREERPRGQIPSDIAAQLSRLDRNEVSTALTRGDALVFLMLCERGVSGALAIEETAISARLQNEELTDRARMWLAELKSDAYIRIGGE